MPVKYSIRNRETGTTIDLYDKNTSQHEVPLGEHKRWIIICKEHEASSSFDKQTTAYQEMTQPSGWCPRCAQMKLAGEKLGPGNSIGRAVARETNRPSVSPNAPPDAGSTPAQPPEQDPEKMTEAELLTANICYRCYGTLKANDGHYHSSGFPVRNICCECAGHNSTEEISIG